MRLHHLFLGMLLMPILALNAGTGKAGALGLPSPARAAAFKAEFHRLCEEGGIVGAAILLIQGDQELLFEAHGYQDEATKALVRRNTAFHWASVTKTLTSLAILQARDRGLLDLDDPITKYLPELRKVHNPFGSMDAITLRHLLSHTSGFRNPTWPWRQGKEWEPFEPTSWGQIVAMLPYSEIEFAPGTRYGYSNPAYIFLARVLEEITGDPFVSHAEKNILRPLGMSGTYYDKAPFHLLDNKSHSYSWSSSKKVREADPFDFHTGITTGNGGLNGPLDDMAKLVRFFMAPAKSPGASSGGYCLLAKRSMDELFAPVVASKDVRDDDQRTLGFWLTRHGGTEWVTHSGGQAGFRSRIAFDPRTGRSVIFAFNTGGMPQTAVAPETWIPVSKRLLNAYLDFVSRRD